MKIHAKNRCLPFLINHGHNPPILLFPAWSTRTTRLRTWSSGTLASATGSPRSPSTPPAPSTTPTGRGTCRGARSSWARGRRRGRSWTWPTGMAGTWVAALTVDLAACFVSFFYFGSRTWIRHKAKAKMSSMWLMCAGYEFSNVHSILILWCKCPRSDETTVSFPLKRNIWDIWFKIFDSTNVPH